MAIASSSSLPPRDSAIPEFDEPDQAEPVPQEALQPMVIEVPNPSDIESCRAVPNEKHWARCERTMSGRTLTDQDVPMDSHTSNSTPPDGNRTGRGQGLLPVSTLLVVFIVSCAASAVEPLRPRRERRRVASHRDQPVERPVSPIRALAPDDTAEADRFAGHGYGDVPGLVWRDDVDEPPQSLSEFELSAPDFVFDEPDPIAEIETASEAPVDDSVADEVSFTPASPSSSASPPPTSLSPSTVSPATPLVPDSLDDGISELTDFATDSDIASLGEWRVARSQHEIFEPESVDASLRMDVPIAPPLPMDQTSDPTPLHPDSLPPRLRLNRVSDEVDLLAVSIERFTVRDARDGEIDCVIRPTFGWSPEDFGGNRRHDLTWADAEQLVLQAWAELAERVWINGSRLEAWMRIDGVGVFVPLNLDESYTIWKFMHEFRTAVELSHR